MSYTSIDSSRRSLQTNGMLYTNFKFVFESLAENKKKTYINE